MWINTYLKLDNDDLAINCFGELGSDSNGELPALGIGTVLVKELGR